MSATLEIIEAGVIDGVDEPLAGQVVRVSGVSHGDGALDVRPAGGEFTGDGGIQRNFPDNAIVDRESATLNHKVVD